VPVRRNLFAVQLVPDSVFALAEMQRLLAEEWTVVRKRAMQIAAGPALSLAPVAAHGTLSSHPSLSCLHVEGGELAGDVRCMPDALPCETDSVQLIVARHVVDCLAPDSGIEAEFARILAPGGVLFLFGLNSLSPWRFWWSQQARRGLRVPRCSSVAHMRRALEQHELTSTDREFLGGTWPAGSSSTREFDADGHGARWHGAWLLIARKQRAAVRPLPVQSRGKRVTLGPALVQAPSRRASA
jgi:hypothetical protein